MRTFFFFLLAWARTTSVPWTLVSIVRTGLSTISLTPTAAARWKTTSHWSTSSATTAFSWTLSMVYPNRGWPRRCRMLSMLPVDRSSRMWTSSPRPR